MSSNICQELLTAMIEQPVFSIAAQSSRVSDGPLPTQKTVLVALGGMFILSCKFSLQASIHFSDYSKDNYIVRAKTPRFGSGEAKGVIEESVRGYDLAR